MSYQEVVDGQISPEVPINENMAALGQAFVFSHDVTADTGLVVGINGGTFDASTVADTTVTCIDDATNYVVAHRTTRAVSTATASTNWDDTATYGRIGRAVFADGVLTWHDERLSEGGIFDHAAAAGGVTSVNGESGAVTLDASDIGIADTGGYFTGTDAEAALQELGAALGAVGSGDVVGPASATNNHLVVFDGTTGKLVKDGGAAPTGTNTGDQTNITGNAGTATALQTARTIGGVQFDGSANISQPFDMLGFYPGLPTASAILLRVPAARAVEFMANFAGSYGTAGAAATASTAFDIQKNGVSIGTATFALGATTATFTSAAGAAQSLAAGNVLSVIAPATPDATLADVGFVFAGTR